MSTELDDRAEFEREFGEAIKRERARRGWTAEMAARRAGIAPTTWQRVENGKSVRNKTFLSVDALFGLPEGTTVRVWQDGGDLQAEFDAHVDPGLRGRDHQVSEQPTPPSDATPTVNSQFELTRQLLKDQIAKSPYVTSSEMPRVIPLAWVLVAVNQLPLEDLATVRTYLEAAEAVRKAERDTSPEGLFDNTAVVIPEVPGLSKLGTILMPRDLHLQPPKKLGELIQLVGDILVSYGRRDGEH